MARVNVYLPDELACRAREAKLNISALARAAVREKLAGETTNAWLDRLGTLPPLEIGHDKVLAAIDETRQELEGSDRCPT